MLSSIAVLGYGFILPADITTFALSLVGRDVETSWYDAAGTSEHFDRWLAEQEIEHSGIDFQMFVCGHPAQVLVSVMVRPSVTLVRSGQQSFIDADFDFAAGYRNIYGLDLARLRYSLDSPEVEIGWHLISRAS